MLEERIQEIMQQFGLQDRKAFTFGHPKAKFKWALPLPGLTVYSFEQFQPFFIYFDTTGISFFPLNLNDKYKLLGRSYVAWDDVKHFTFKKGLLLEAEIQVELENGRIQMKISKAKAQNPWVKENNAYLIENNHFCNK